jgi:hypothetical protein
MSEVRQATSWVFYKMTLHGKADPVNAVCSQSEWDEMEAARPGFHTLVRSGIASEAEAEKLARGTAGDKLGSRTRRL